MGASKRRTPPCRLSAPNRASLGDRRLFHNQNSSRQISGRQAAAEGLTLSPAASDGAARFAVERSPMPARAVPLACLGALLLTGCDGVGQTRPVDTARIVDAIKTDEVHWNADYRSGDAGRIARHYAPDAVAMHPGYP